MLLNSAQTTSTWSRIRG